MYYDLAFPPTLSPNSTRKLQCQVKSTSFYALDHLTSGPQPLYLLSFQNAPEVHLFWGHFLNIQDEFGCFSSVSSGACVVLIIIAPAEGLCITDGTVVYLRVWSMSFHEFYARCCLPTWEKDSLTFPFPSPCL